MVVGLRQESFWPKVFRRIKVIIIIIIIIICCAKGSGKEVKIQEFM
jgi:hypothetical protein